MAQQTVPNGKCLSSCVLNAQIATHPEEGDFVGGELVISHETSLCFSAGQHKSAQHNVFGGHGATMLLVRRVGTQTFNFVENGEVSNVLLFNRKMKSFSK